MAIKRKFDAVVPVQLAGEWRDRIRAVADHERINDSMAAVVRDCVEVALPGFELELGIRSLDDLTEAELEGLGLNKVEPPTAPVREDRAKGSFGYSEVVRPTG